MHMLNSQYQHITHRGDGKPYQCSPTIYSNVAHARTAKCLIPCTCRKWASWQLWYREATGSSHLRDRKQSWVHCEKSSTLKTNKQANRKWQLDLITWPSKVQYSANITANGSYMQRPSFGLERYTTIEYTMNSIRKCNNSEMSRWK